MYQHIQITFVMCFPIQLTWKTVYSVLKLDYPFGCIKTYVVILRLHTESFSPQAEYAAQVYPAQLRDTLGNCRETGKVAKGLGLNG